MSARVRQSVVSSICAVSGQQTASVPRARASRAHAPHYTLRTDRRAYDTRRGEWRRRAACRCRTPRDLAPVWSGSHRHRSRTSRRFQNMSGLPLIYYTCAWLLCAESFSRSRGDSRCQPREASLGPCRVPCGFGIDGPLSGWQRLPSAPHRAACGAHS